MQFSVIYSVDTPADVDPLGYAPPQVGDLWDELLPVQPLPGCGFRLTPPRHAARCNRHRPRLLCASAGPRRLDFPTNGERSVKSVTYS